LVKAVSIVGIIKAGDTGCFFFKKSSFKITLTQLSSTLLKKFLAFSFVCQIPVAVPEIVVNAIRGQFNAIFAAVFSFFGHIRNNRCSPDYPLQTFNNESRI
jgi:hypothetical protein